MTPFELRLCLEARNEDLVDDRARDLWQAWHTAYLGRVDKFPHLSELMPKILQHKPGGANDSSQSGSSKPDVGIELMNALLQLPAAPPRSKRKALDASDPPTSSPVSSDAVPPAAESSA